MNFVHFSTYDRGGAAQAAYRFHSNLVASGHQSSFFVMYKTCTDENVITSKYRWSSTISKIKNRLKIKLHIYKEKYSFYNEEFNNKMDFDFYKKNINFKPDAIILHWVTEFVDLKVIKQLQDEYNVPIFWYLMDMAPMTGGCHYAWDCDGYKDLCQACPAVEWPYKGLPVTLLKYKKELLDSMDIKVLSGTGWLKKQLLNSTIFKKKSIYDLMLGIDIDVFKPVDENTKKSVREKYGITSDCKVIFFGASKIHDERKGFMYLIKALESLSADDNLNRTNLAIVTAGKIENENVFANIKIKHFHLGYLKGSKELAQAYQLADVVVSPSIEDSGPMMINESVMCGTPVVAFDMGVASDLILTNETGYLANLKDVDDLAYGIKNLIELNEDECMLMQGKCRDIAMKKTSEHVQLNTFLNIMEKQ